MTRAFNLTCLVLPSASIKLFLQFHLSVFLLEEDFQNLSLCHCMQYPRPKFLMALSLSCCLPWAARGWGDPWWHLRGCPRALPPSHRLKEASGPAFMCSCWENWSRLELCRKKRKKFQKKRKKPKKQQTEAKQGLTKPKRIKCSVWPVPGGAATLPCPQPWAALVPPAGVRADSPVVALLGKAKIK